ncbi:MAG TPA: DUF2911 domain-containing protein [Opitutaceae bacterium]|nr:DUF2911 domain-containing protein [Opitutaceae bacterium]
MVTTLIRTSVLAALLLGAASYISAQPAQEPKLELPAPSPASVLKQRVGLTDIQIEYSRPGVKGREIFGGLVAYGQVWRTGANSATKITFSTPIKLNGSEVAAGTYGLFTIPDKNAWTVILNRDEAQWGAYQYDQAKDVVRVPAQVASLPENVETFTIDIADIRDESAELVLRWEKTRVSVKLEVDVASKVLPQIQAIMSSDGKKSAGLLFGAAQFYYDHGQDLNKALTWIDQAVGMNPKAHYMVYLKARILAKLGRKDEAVAAAKKSIELATAGKDLGYVKLNNDLIGSLK